MEKEVIKVGVIGCGVISEIYMKNAQKFEAVEFVACADLIAEKAEKRAKQFNIKAVTDEELLADPEIELVLNITEPYNHLEVSLMILNAGKNLYTEKPLAVNIEEGKQIVDLAKEKGLRVGVAPDLFLGGRLQTFRKLIDDGWIGDVLGASCSMVCHGHEVWHPNPEFYYKRGGGPLFDMGPYYVSALLSLMGPVKRVSGAKNITFNQRTITSEPLNGQVIGVDVPTHVSGTIEFKSGAIAGLTTSFDVWNSKTPRFEIYGTRGTLCMEDADPMGGPNLFGGETLLKTHKDIDWWHHDLIDNKETPWHKIPTLYDYNTDSRCLGLSDMATALISGREHRASLEMGFHTLEVMDGIYKSADSGKYYNLEGTFTRPEPLPLGLTKYVLDK